MKDIRESLGNLSMVMRWLSKPEEAEVLNLLQIFVIENNLDTIAKLKEFVDKMDKR